MTIGNDSFTIGTAAVAAGGANIIAQKKDAIKTVAITTKDAFVKGTKAAVTTKEPYINIAKAVYKPIEKVKDLGNKVKTAFNNSASMQELVSKLKGDVRDVTIERIKNLKAEKLMNKLNKEKVAQMAKDSAFNISEESNKYFAKHGIKFPTLKSKIKNLGTTVLNKTKSIDWKKAGKYAGVAAVIATAAVVAKNLFFSPSKDDFYEI